MKAIIRASVLSGLFILSLVLFICTKLNAQTIISIDSSSDSTVVMKLSNSDLLENPQKLILIIDKRMLPRNIPLTPHPSIIDM